MRTRRTRVLSAANRRAKVLFNTGALPQLRWGVEAIGIPKARLKSFRGLMLQAAAKSTKERSTDVAIMLENLDGYDPVEEITQQVLKEWSATCMSIGLRCFRPRASPQRAGRGRRGP